MSKPINDGQAVQPAVAAQNLTQVVKLLQSVAQSPSFLNLETILSDRLLLLEQVQQLKDQVVDLKQKVEDSEANNKTQIENLFRVHVDEIAKVNVEKTEIKKQLSIAEAKAAEKEKTAANLHKANTEVNAHAQKTQSELELERASKTAAQKEIETLLAKVKDYDSKMQQQQVEISGHEGIVQNQKSKIRELQENLASKSTDLQKTSESLAEIRSYGATLEDNNLTRVCVLRKFCVVINVSSTQASEKLWKRCLKVVQDAFEVDLHENVLQDASAFRGLQSNAPLEHSIPLALSNTTNAKMGRMLVVLGIITQLMVQDIFKSTCLVNGDFELQRDLLDLATRSPSKESHTRAVLLSMDDPGFRQHRVNEIVLDAHKCVKDLLSHKESAIFRTQLTGIFQDADELWHMAQCQTSRVGVSLDLQEPKAELCHSVQLAKKEIGFQEQKAARDLPEDSDIAIKIFPHFFVVDQQKIKTMIPPKVVLRKQITPLGEEIGKGQRTGIYRRPTSSIEGQKRSNFLR